MFEATEAHLTDKVVAKRKWGHDDNSLFVDGEDGFGGCNSGTRLTGTEAVIVRSLHTRTFT
jgi:hypothetical protein